MTLARPAVHEIFFAHAGADRAAAETLFDLLQPDVRAWLDTRCLLPGDEWPKEIVRAQHAALATVALLSRNAEHAYYLTDEIHAAIALFRRSPDKHRVVAVFLDGLPADPAQVPAGLHGLHSLDAAAEGGLAAVASKLKSLVTVLRERAAKQPPPAPPQPSAGVKPSARGSSPEAHPIGVAAAHSRPDVRAILVQVLRSDSDLTPREFSTSSARPILTRPRPTRHLPSAGSRIRRHRARL